MQYLSEPREDGRRKLRCENCGHVSSFTLSPPDRYRHTCKPKQLGRPGDELKKLLSELGITDFAGCGCNDKAAQMNAWGVDGCRENFDTIRGWIIEAQKKASWSTAITATVRATATGLALQIDPADVAGSLVQIAIERAAKG